MNEHVSAFNEVLADLLGRLMPGIELGGLALLVITAIVATVLALAAFFIVKGLSSWIQRKILSLHIENMGGFKLQNQQLLTGNQINWAIRKLFRWLRYLAYIIIFYLYINIIFSFFPETQGISTALFTQFLNAVGFVLRAIWNYIPNLLTLIVIFAFGFYAIRLAGLFFKGIEARRIRISGFYPDWAGPTFTIVRFLIIVFVIIVAFPYLPGKESPAFQAVSIFFGILVSLGSTGAVSNVVSGIALTYMRAFKNGDSVKIADTTGEIVEKTMFVTRIRTIKNVEITIPNAMVLNNHIINYSSLADKEGLILHTKVTIGYDVPWRRVHDLLKEAALATEGIDKTPEPFVLQTSLDDYYVEYEINAYTKKPKQMAVIYNELHRNIQDVFHAKGVEIASPSLTAFREGTEYIPDDYLPKDYNPPKPGPWPFSRGETKKPEE